MPNRCYMCKTEEEIGDYILLHCPKAHMLWQLIFSLFDVQWVIHSSVRGGVLELGWFLSWQRKEKGLKSCSFMPFWSIWREKNRGVFKNCESLDQTIKSYFLYLFWDWVKIVYRG